MCKAKFHTERSLNLERCNTTSYPTCPPGGGGLVLYPALKLELQEVVDTLRESVLKSRFAMERFCYEHGGKIDGGYVQNYGYIVETEHYRYCLRCTPFPGDYQGYLYCYDLRQQQMAQQNRAVGRATFANGEQREYHDPQTYLAAIRQELPYRDVTGFRYETLTDDPAVRKQVDDILFDLYGEENPHSLADYENNPGQNMNMGGM